MSLPNSPLALTKRFTLSFFWLSALAFLVNYLAIYYITYPLDYVYSDMRGYLERAWDLASSGSIPKFHAFYPPGNSYFYAALLSLFGFSQGVKVIILSHLLMLTLSQVLFALSARMLFASNACACLALLGMSLYFPFALQGSLFMSEPLFSLLLALSTFLFSWLLLSSTVKVSGKVSGMLLLGLMISSSALVKGQGWAMVPAVIAAILFFASGRHLLKALPFFVLGLLLPLPLQFAVNSAILGKTSLFSSANDGYNFYLGHSRRAAVGCFHEETNIHYVFHNNNTALWDSFREPEIVPAEIWDRDLFKQKTKALWLESPKRQLLIAAANVVELFKINPTWPSRSNQEANKYEIWSKRWALWLITIPGIYGIIDAVFRKRYRQQVLLLLVPILAMAAIASISMGQPRYLIAFQYFAFLLALPWYRDCWNFIARYFWPTDLPEPNND